MPEDGRLLSAPDDGRLPSAPGDGRPSGPWDGPPLSQLRPSAVVDGATRLTADEVDARADAVAGWLHARGVGAGATVAWQLPNCWESLVLLHACWRLAAVAAPLHPQLGPAETQRLAQRLEPALVVRDRGELSDASGRRAPAIDVDASALAVVLATSGSTGAPKLVRHTHRGLAYKAQVMTSAHGLHDDDVVLMPAPLAHISGLLNGVLLPAAAGMTTVLMPRWSTGPAVELIAREHVSFMAGPPTYFSDLAESVGARDDVASLRLVSTGGASVTPALVDLASERLGAFVKRTYGSTEAPTVTTTHEGDPPACARDTDGRAVGAVQLRLDPLTGELLVRGPEVCAGYVDAHDTEAAFDGGWLRTGDLATIDAGWVTIVGRTSEVIIRGGENVTPAEVESACATLPGARRVVAVGYEDARLGQRIALVVESDGAIALDTVRAHCEMAGLAPFKIPERVIVVATLPWLAAGKPDRLALARMVAAAVP